MLLALGCSHGGGSTRAEAAPSGALAAGADPLASLSPEVRTLAREVEQARGLRFRRPVEFLPVEDADLDHHLEEGRIEPAPDASAPEALWAFGFLRQRPPPDWLLSLLPRSRRQSDTLLAFYVHSSRRVYARKRVMASHEVVAHELAHALVHDVFTFSADTPSDDQQLAVRALSEGDATLTAALVMQARQGGSAAAALRRASAWDLSSRDHAVDPTAALAGTLPLYHEREEVPYSTGARFVAAVIRARGLGGLNEVWAHPPRGTFEVFHPDLYARGLPLPAMKDASLPERCRPGEEGRMGELRTRAFLRIRHPRATALSGAHGLLTDRYRLLKDCSDGPAFVWQTAWLDEPSAERFERLARELVGCTGQGCLPGDGVVLRRQTEVVVVRGLADQELASRALAAITPATTGAEPRLGGVTLEAPAEEPHLIEGSSGKPCTIAASGVTLTPPRGMALQAGHELSCHAASDLLDVSVGSVVTNSPYTEALVRELHDTLPRALAATHTQVELRQRRRATPIGTGTAFDFKLTDPLRLEVLVVPVCDGKRTLSLYLRSASEEARAILEETIASLRPRSVGLDAACGDPVDE